MAVTASSGPVLPAATASEARQVPARQVRAGPFLVPTESDAPSTADCPIQNGFSAFKIGKGDYYRWGIQGAPKDHATASLLLLLSSYWKSEELSL